MRVEVTVDDAAGLGVRTVIARHDLHENPLFSDESLAVILERHPPDRLVALAMGHDPTMSSDNERLDHTGLSGAQLLQAVATGRLWLNVTAIDQVDERFSALIGELYDSVGSVYPPVRGVETHATLLVSSPGAMVYFHVDAPSSYLWHIRGSKRVWVYPALDQRVLARELLEDVFAGARQEYVPYEHRFDEVASVFDLEPGDVAMWPQNAPHRVVNHDSLNVSLVTDHFTEDGRARARVYKANRFLRVRGHVPQAWLGTRPDGAVAAAKVGLHKVAAAAGFDAQVSSKQHRTPTRRIDPSVPGGSSARPET
jgi:hypothetical protein